MSEPLRRSLPWRAQQLLGAPRALGVLAELVGLRLGAVRDAYAGSPEPPVFLSTLRTNMIGPLHAAGWASRRREHSPQPRTVLEPYVDALQDVERLTAVTLRAVSGWAWYPLQQSVRQFLLADAPVLADVAVRLSAAPAAWWWWEPLRRQDQILLGSPATPPDLDELAARATPREAPRFRLPAGIRTSTRLGPRLPATQLCDVGVTSRHGPQIGCWSVPVTAHARVYELHGPSDWLRLCERHPTVANVPGEWLTWGIHTPWALSPDWRAVAHEWDAIHLSVAGLLTACGNPMVTGARGTIAETADSEITIWFRPCFGRPTLSAIWDTERDDLPAATTTSETPRREGRSRPPDG